jgi:hypothetical protein
MIIYLFFWPLLYNIFNRYISNKYINNIDLDPIVSNLVSFIHASTTCFLSCLLLLTQDQWRWDDGFTPIQKQIITFSQSYFIYDLIYMFMYSYSSTFVLHHIFVLLAYYISLTYNYGSKSVFCTIFIGEITNPLQITYFISKYLKLEKINAYFLPIFSFNFLIFRNIIFPISFCVMYYQMINDNFQPVPYFSLMILHLAGIFGGILWSKKLIRIIKSKFID